MLDLKEFVCHCNKLYAIAAGPYTRGSLEISTEGMKKENFFFAMCKLHQEDFTLMHQDTNDVTQKQMIIYFEVCFCKDVNSGRKA